MAGHPGVVVVAVLVVLAVGATVVVLAARAHREQEQVVDGARRRAAVIVNPTKFDDVDAVRREVEQVCREAGWDTPLWLETTEDDPGKGQAKQALGEGVDLVCPLGGDGTVRCVAEAVVHSGVPIGLLPGGTGNLLARNLELPLADVPSALRTALDGVDRTIDVGLVTFDRSGEDRDAGEQVFLVMAGLGFDAQMMADAPEKLKNKVGWMAYTVSGLKNLRGAQAKARISADGGEMASRRIRSVLAANCGTLTGGIELLPEAEVDDGWLDAVSLSPRGIVSWAVVAVRILTRQGHHRVEKVRCKELSVRVDRPTQAQLDGDVVGEVRALRARIDPGALVVRVPAGS